MNCDKARQILNSVFDGESIELPKEVEAHLCECAACREWHASMARTVELMHSLKEPPVPDIAAMVSRRLPPQHPAASRQGRADWRPVLALLAGGALSSTAAAVVVLVLVSRLLGGGLLTAISIGRTLVSDSAALLVAGKAVAEAMAHAFTGLGRVALGLSPILLWAVAANLAIVIVALLIWRRRPSVTTSCFI